MNGERFERVEALFHAALAQPPEARARFLAKACGPDEALRREVTDLLANASDDSFLERPAAADLSYDLPQGSHLGPYEIDRLIGAGGMGEVYKARDTRLRRTVALKMLPRHLREKPDLRARFEREARSVASFTHPNICSLHDIVHDARYDFLVMEYVDGETLADKLRGGPLSVNETIRVGAAVASALAAAHAKGLIHRDIKPANIMIAPDGATKLVDFGLARAAAVIDGPAPSGGTGLTETGVFMGTPHYMSPEQAVGQALDARTDIFSLGVVLFECLTGKRPFDGDTQSDYLKNLISTPPRSVRGLRGDVRPDLERLIARCLEKNVAERQITASELSGELDRMVQSAGSRDAQRRRWLWIAAIALVVMAAALVGWGMMHSSSTPRTASIETPEPVVRWPSREWNSRISPDGAWVSFVSDRGGTTRIWMKRLQQEEEVHGIDMPPGTIQGHAWSPDSREIVCVIGKPGELFLYIVPALAAGAPRLRVRIDRPGLWTPVVWVGTRVFLNTEKELLQFELRTGEFRNLTADWKITPNLFDVQADGRRVVYSVRAHSHNDLWMANVDGSGAVQLTNDPYSHSAAIWAGRDAIVYASDRGGQNDLWRLNLVDRSTQQITFSADREIPESASPDGTMLTFQQNTDEADLWELDPQTGVERQLTSDGRSYFWPSVASSHMIASQVLKPKHRAARLPMLDTDVVVGVRDGADFRLLVGREVDSFMPRLSSDGKWLAFLQWPEQKELILPLLVVKALDTGASTMVTDRFAIPGHTNSPFDPQGSAMVWSRDHPDLYFVSRNAAGAPEVRRFRAGSTRESDLIVGELPPKDVVVNLLLSGDGTRLAYNRWAEADNHVKIHVRDLASRADRVVWTGTAASRFDVQLKGWRTDDAALIVLRSTPEQAAYRVELLQIGVDGIAAAPALVAQRAYGFGARFSPASGEMYITTVDGTIHNISAFSLADGRLRPLTHNTLAGVTFSGLELVPDGTLVFSREETKQDIWTIMSRR